MEIIHPVTLDLASKALDVAALRHSVIAQNIANVNVAGAQRMTVAFEAALDSEQAQGLASSGSASSLGGAQAEVVPDVLSPTISMEREMAEMSRNSLNYQTLVRAISRQLSTVAMAINEGRR